MTTSVPSTIGALELREFLEKTIFLFNEAEHEHTASPSDMRIETISSRRTPLEYLRTRSSTLDAELQRIERILEGHDASPDYQQNLLLEACKQMLVHLTATSHGRNPQIPCRRELPETEENPQKRASMIVEAFVPNEFPLPPPFGGLQLLCLETVLLQTKKQVVDSYRKLQSSREVLTLIESTVRNDRLVSSKIKDLQSASILALTDQYKAKNESRHGLLSKFRNAIPAKVDKFFRINANAFTALVEMNSSFHDRVPSAYRRIYQQLHRISSLVKGSVEIVSLDELNRVMTDTHGKLRKYFADSAVPLPFPLNNEELSQENPVERMIAIHEAINKTAASLRRSRSASPRRSY